MEINELKENLLKVYDSKTAYPKCSWSKDNPTLGQCAVTSLIVKDYFGGDIYKHNKENHYFNVIDGKVIDLTKEQFDYELDYTDSRKKMPDLNSGKTKERYELLKERLKSGKK